MWPVGLGPAHVTAVDSGRWVCPFGAVMDEIVSQNL